MLGTDEIIRFLERESIRYEIEGNQQIKVDSYSQLDCISEHKITWVKKWTKEIEEQLSKFESLIIVCNKNAEINREKNCYILCEDPKMCFFEILGGFYAKKDVTELISQNAIVETTKIGEGSSIGVFSYIGKDVEIGKNVQIGSHVTITGRVIIGDNSKIASGAVLGKPGYGYYMANDGHRKQVPHLGGIIIGKYVDIGANTCIDCGAMGDTVIGNYTKIDNLCHIAHNVEIGEDVLIIAGSVLCGSCRILNGSYIAPGAVIRNQIEIGKNAFVGMQTAATRDVKSEESIFGVPGKVYERKYKI